MITAPSSLSAKAQQAFELAAEVPDPEIPVLNLQDLGIFRGVREDAQGITVLLTPTYSGCPATEAIAQDVRQSLDAAGLHEAKVNVSLSPAWTSEWITEQGRRKLKEYGIAPPACTTAQPSSTESNVIAFRRKQSIACPRCNSTHTEQLSNFGSTPCKSLYRCVSCREPFDYFKPY